MSRDIIPTIVEREHATMHDGKRYCRTCRRERNRAAQERRKAATA